MKYLNKYLLFLLIIFTSFSCSNKLSIKPLNPYVSRTNDTIIEGKKMGKTLFKYFYIDNYNYGDTVQFKQLKKFTLNKLDEGYSQFSQYEVYFYRKTDILNKNFIDSDNNELAWHYKDLIFIFLWSNGKYTGYLQFKNGKCINESEFVKNKKLELIK